MNGGFRITFSIRLFLAATVLIVCAASAWSSVIEFEVTSAADSGAGTLRAALTNAAEDPERPMRIHFGDREGFFSTPQIIELESPLPAIRGEIVIDGFIPQLLWRAYGVTVSGAHRHRIFEVADGGALTLRGITLRNGQAPFGAAILNRGRLELEGVSVFDNRAEAIGGAIANRGEVVVVNSTLAWNRAGKRGGGLANFGGDARLINTTLFENEAMQGGAVWSSGSIHLANSILAGDYRVQQCFNAGSLSEGTTHNLIYGGHFGCGEPILEVDPELGSGAAYYNGPTQTIAIASDSPVVHMGSNEAAVDAHGEPLKWDQRGNGDPRRAGGYTDLGAFEQQGHLPEHYLVDTIDDPGLRSCSQVRDGDCSLRAAIELASVARHPTPVRFDPKHFSGSQEFVLPRLPDVGGQAIRIDGQGTGSVSILVPDEVSWEVVNGARIAVRAPIARVADEY